MDNLIILFIASISINLLMFIPAYFFKTDKLTDISYALTFIILALFVAIYQNIWIASLLVIIWAIRLGVYLLIRIIKIKKDKRFDNIRESRIKFLGFWLLQGLTVGIILVPLFLSSNNDFFVGGIVIRVVGLFIESIADYQKFKFILDKKPKWIDTGIWQYSRHPNYFGEILCRIGLYITVLPSLSFNYSLIALISPLYIIVLLSFVSGIPILEKNANKKRGDQKEYKDYIKKTSILIPRFNKN